MPTLILPDTFAPPHAAFQPCFTAPNYRNFGLLVSGWVHCPTPSDDARPAAA